MVVIGVDLGQISYPHEVFLFCGLYEASNRNDLLFAVNKIMKASLFTRFLLAAGILSENLA